jgi:hypothetical protein
MFLIKSTQVDGGSEVISGFIVTSITQGFDSELNM